MYRKRLILGIIKRERTVSKGDWNSGAIEFE